MFVGASFEWLNIQSVSQLVSQLVINLSTRLFLALNFKNKLQYLYKRQRYNKQK
jgi:hypothetical protein